MGWTGRTKAAAVGRASRALSRSRAAEGPLAPAQQCPTNTVASRSHLLVPVEALTLGAAGRFPHLRGVARSLTGKNRII